MILLAIKDMKHQTFLPVHCAEHLSHALRSFEATVNQGNNQFSTYPNDFRLFHLADFNFETGRVTPLEDARDLGSAADFIRPSQAQNTLPFPQSASSN